MGVKVQAALQWWFSPAVSFCGPPPSTFLSFYNLNDGEEQMNHASVRAKMMHCPGFVLTLACMPDCQHQKDKTSDFLKAKAVLRWSGSSHESHPLLKEEKGRRLMQFDPLTLYHFGCCCIKVPGHLFCNTWNGVGGKCTLPLYLSDTSVSGKVYKCYHIQCI